MVVDDQNVEFAAQQFDLLERLFAAGCLAGFESGHAQQQRRGAAHAVVVVDVQDQAAGGRRGYAERKNLGKLG